MTVVNVSQDKVEGDVNGLDELVFKMEDRGRKREDVREECSTC